MIEVETVDAASTIKLLGSIEALDPMLALTALRARGLLVAFQYSLIIGSEGWIAQKCSKNQNL